MTYMSEDLKRDLQVAAKREQRLRIKIALSIIIGVIILWIIL